MLDHLNLCIRIHDRVQLFVKLLSSDLLTFLVLNWMFFDNLKRHLEIATLLFS